MYKELGNEESYKMKKGREKKHKGQGRMCTGWPAGRFPNEYRYKNRDRNTMKQMDQQKRRRKKCGRREGSVLFSIVAQPFQLGLGYL